MSKDEHQIMNNKIMNVRTRFIKRLRLSGADHETGVYLKHPSPLLHMYIQAVQVQGLLADGGHVVERGTPLLQKTQQPVEEVATLRLAAHLVQFVHIASLLQRENEPHFLSI